MRRLFTTLILGACLSVPVVSAPTFYGVVDTAQVDHLGAYVYLLAQGWLAGPGLDVTGSFYIDGQYAASSVAQHRPDVCNAFHAQSLACAMELNKPCADGSYLMASTACVGIEQQFIINGMSSGEHNIKICAAHAETSTSTPTLYCTAEKAFRRP